MPFWRDAENNFRWRRLFLVIILTLILLITALIFTFGTVVSAKVANVVLVINPFDNTISEPITGPRWQMFAKPPWAYTTEIYVGVDSLGMWGDGTDPYADFPTIKCFSRDQLEMEIDIMIRWRLDIAKVRQLYLNLPSKNWKNDIIASVAREQIRLITKEFTTIETIEQRDLVAQTIRDAIWNKLNTEVSLAGSVMDFEFELRNIGYPLAYTAAIEAKLVAEQAKIQAEFEKAKIIIMANASAQAVIIKANAEAEAKVIVANGTREAIELILEASGGTTNSTRIAELYIWVETLKQIAPDIDLFLMTTGEDGIPILVSIPTNSTG